MNSEFLNRWAEHTGGFMMSSNYEIKQPLNKLKQQLKNQDAIYLSCAYNRALKLETLRTNE